MVMPNIMEQLVEGRGSPACLKVLLDYVQLFSREYVTPQKTTFKNSRHWNFQGGFFPYSVQVAQFLFGL